jgi:hypothetical protein
VYSCMHVYHVCVCVYLYLYDSILEVHCATLAISHAAVV